MIKKILLIIAIASSSLSFGQKIAAGGYHSLFLCSDSTVKSCGWNSHGQLGTGNNVDKTLPEGISNLSGITAISAGFRSSLFLKSDSTVLACGENLLGQLGNGNTVNQLTPVPVIGINQITAVGMGSYHSLFLKKNGTVWGSGESSYGALGNSFPNSGSSTPLQIYSATKAIAVGRQHSLFLKNDGSVWGCGFNFDGQLGNGYNTSSIFKKAAISGTVIAIATESGHSLFIKNDSTVWACGSNFYGQLGTGNRNSTSVPIKVDISGKVVAIAAGFGHSLFLKNDSTVWACGHNDNGQLGAGGNIHELTPVQIMSNVVEIFAKNNQSYFRKSDGTILVCGDNTQGQLGIGESGNHYKYLKPLGNFCAPPTLPQSTMNMDDNGGAAATVCEGSNVNITSTTVGSNPDLQLVLDNSISLNNPIAIDKNSHAVFVLNNNNSVTAYNFDGTIYKTYPSLSLNNIWAFTVDENDNLYINNGSVNGSGYLQIHKCDSTGTLIESIPTAFMNASNLVTDLIYYNQPGSLENLFFSDTLNGQHAINYLNMNDNNALTNSGAIYIYNRKYTSLSMDNFYADKRLLMADPINHILASTQMFNNGTSIEDTLIDAASTAGMALDYIHADTSLSAQLSLAGSAMLVSSRTKGIIGMVTSYLNPDGTIISSIDTTLTSYFNAVAPVGGVLVKNNNQLEYWVADNSQNKLLRLSLSSYSITPTLPAGLIFNSVTGVIEGTPTTVTASQTYTLTIYGSSGYTSTSTFTLGVTPSNSVSNTTGTTSSTTNQTDGTTKNYIDDQNCTQLVVVTDFVGGTSPGQTRVEQTVTTASMVTVGNSNFVRRVTNIQAQQTESLNAKITFFYTYKDIKDFNTANPTNTFTNDTLAGSMQIYMLHMHETFDTLNRVWRKVPTYYGPLFALWIPNKHVWETSTNITKLSEFYAHPSSIASTFDCKNSGKDTIVANDFYVWNYPDSLFASGDYVDTLINHTGCDSIVQLHLTINITTGLNEAALNSGISVFPNPSNGVFNIRFNNAVIMPSKVRVISVLGTEVMNKTITSSDSIDLSPYESGIYFLSIENEGATKTWRIVKQN